MLLTQSSRRTCWGIAGMMLVLAGCASVPGLTGGRESVAPAPGPVVRAVTEAPDVAPLQGASIPAGKCGMLLWTLTAGEPELVFRAIRDEGAEMNVDGETGPLSLVRQSGDSRFGLASTQEYVAPRADGDLLQASVNISFGLAFEGGVYVDNGTIALVNAAGWERLLPVAGITGCRS